MLSLLAAALLYAGDQLTKLWVVQNLVPGREYPVVPGLLWWEHIRNSGGAFSLGAGSTWIFTVVMSVVVVGILWNLRRVRDGLWALALGLVLGGALGNLTDRLLREPGVGRGHVVDFIAVPHFAIFNVADCGVVVGIGLLLVLILRGREMGGDRDR
ncbi:signal peptidase II [Kocuria varians]